MSAIDTEQVPTVLNEWKVGKLLGTGGLASVYEVSKEGESVTWAAKVVTKNKGKISQEVVSQINNDTEFKNLLDEMYDKCHKVDSQIMEDISAEFPKTDTHTMVYKIKYCSLYCDPDSEPNEISQGKYFEEVENFFNKKYDANIDKYLSPNIDYGVIRLNLELFRIQQICNNKKNNNVQHIPKIYGLNSMINTLEIEHTDTHSYFIIECLPEGCLHDHLDKLRKKVNANTPITQFTVLKGLVDDEYIFEVGRCLINFLQTMHTIGMLHLDIKPANILLSDETLIKICDFGLATPATPVKCGLTSKRPIFAGTAEFAGIHVHNLDYESKRDDLESVGYVLVYLFLGGTLPWVACDHKEIRLQITDVDLPEKLSQLTEKTIIKEYLQYVRNLEVDETPDYSYLLNLMSYPMSSKQSVADVKKSCMESLCYKTLKNRDLVN